MAKPKGENQKAVTARERKADAATSKKAAQEKIKEDKKWEDSDKHIDRKVNRAADKVNRKIRKNGSKNDRKK